MHRLVINRYSHTKTERALKDGLDPTVESIGVVLEPYHQKLRLSRLDGDEWQVRKVA